ncbi:MAG: hypothetical protein U0V75_14625 [Ferruginibacter sp.]
MNTALVNNTRLEADTAAWFFVTVLLLLGLTHFGRRIAAWVLTKLHEFFIEQQGEVMLH